MLFGQLIDPSHTLHFVGIGGIGMSGLAELLHRCGYRVQGSDLAEGGNVEKLRQLGIEVTIGHSRESINSVGIIVYSGAVAQGNEELLRARELGVIIYHRAELLVILSSGSRTIAVSGSHGKTTTTAMIAAIFDAAGMDPTVIVGGIVNQYESNVKLGSSQWMVIEADESDGTMQDVEPEVAVVTNMGDEHISHYKSIAILQQSFLNFLNRAGSFVVVSTDIREILREAISPTVITYDAPDKIGAVQQINNHTEFELLERGIANKIVLSSVGYHNINNALAAIAVALGVGISMQHIQKGLLNFRGVQRRFSVIAELDGIKFIDDYAHHPTEIRATYLAAQSVASGKVIAVVQPHRFSRVKDFFDRFVEVLQLFDFTILTNVYAAGETAILGCSSDDLMLAVQKTGCATIMRCGNDVLSISQEIVKVVKKGDVVVFMGAGNISLLARNVVKNW